MHFDLPALKPLFKIDGLKIWGAGRRPEERVEGTLSVHDEREQGKFLFGGLKSFVKNLLFFVELWFRQLFSDSCLYMLEFSPFDCTYLRTVTSFRIPFLIPCCLSTNILYIHNG